jgi:hypothetical protein
MPFFWTRVTFASLKASDNGTNASTVISIYTINSTYEQNIDLNRYYQLEEFPRWLLIILLLFYI